MKNLSLLQKAVISAFILAIPVLITFLVTFRINKEYIKDSTMNDIASIAKGYEMSAYYFLEMIKIRAQDFASDGFIREHLSKIIQGKTDEAEFLNRHLIKNKMPLDKAIHEIYVVTLDGRIAGSTDPSEIGKDISNEMFFIKGRRETTVIDIPSGHESIPELAVSTPVLDIASKKPIGVLVNFVSLTEFRNVIGSEFIRQNETVSWEREKRESFVIQTVNGSKLLIGESPFRGNIGKLIDEPPVDACLKTNAETSSLYKDYLRGVKVVSASMCIPSMKWTLMVKIDEKEALKSVEFIQKGSMVTASVVAGLGIILFSMYIRYIVRPIKKITSGAEEIAEGNYNVNIPVESNDEIGTLSSSFNNMVREIKGRTQELVKLNKVIENSVNIVFITNPEGGIEYVNPMFEKITGWSKHESIGMNLSILASPETLKDKFKHIFDTINAGRTWQGVCQNKRRDGSLYWANCIISPIKNENGNITNFLAVQEDITEKKEAEERARYLVSYDDLTGLLTRQRFIEEVGAWMENHNTSEDTGALILIDVDDFKSLNDIYGHLIGDEFLHRVAGMLKEVAQMEKKEVFLSRLGEDEFSIFIPESTETECMSMAEMVRKEISSIYFEPLTAHFTASIGCALYPEHGTTVSELFTKVDTALRHAKETGRNRCRLFREEDRDIETMHSRLNEKVKIQSALMEDRFLPWFQPILDLKNNKIEHYEALARMIDENGNILSPAAFVSTAERFGIISDIDRIIAEETIRLQAEMAKKGRHLSFSINLSAKDLVEDEFLFFISSKIIETGAHPNYLIFEVTETAAVHDMNRVIKFISALKGLGCRFALDDFGVGFTSFLYLQQMQVDYIKIDGAFVRRMNESINDQLFVRAMTDIAKGLGIKTIAEFVENDETLKILKEFGVDYAQGYAVGKPSPELL